ncbi:efflux RND transporter periplasmic adaptor subunit [candidate division WWE3 bacterium]|nr:efflux RND transporter periplasmic adaptor subunit [candidate division WWE3 bacterium]
MKKYVILLIILAALGGAGYWYYQKAQSSSNNTITYTTSPVTQGTLITSITGSGSLSVEQSATISPLVSGTIKEIKFKKGDLVKSGDVVAILTNDDLNLQLAAANTGVKQAQAGYNKKLLDVKQAWETIYDLDKKEAANGDSVTDLQHEIASQALKSTELDLEAAQNTINDKQKTLKDVQESIANLQVKSTLTGTVTEVTGEVGNTVGSSSSQSSQNSTASAGGIMTIATLDKLLAQIALNENDVDTVKLDQIVTLTFDAIDSYTTTGKVATIDYLGTNSQGVVSYPITISLDSFDTKVKPGMTVNASIITKKKDNVLMVPNAAVKYQNEQAYVQILSNGQPVNKNVEIGIANDDYTEIVNGIALNEEVVTATLSPGSSSSSTSQTGNSFFQNFGAGGPPTNMRQSSSGSSSSSGAVRGIQSFR